MHVPTVLIADDDRSIRTVLTQALGRSGYQVRSTSSAATLWRWIEDGEGDLVITDVVMPDENGLDLIPRIRRIRPELRIVVMSAQSTLITAVKAAQRGAFDYLPKPFDLAELLAVVQRALAVRPPAPAPAEPRDEDEKLPLIGRSPAMQEIYRTIARLTTADLTVMVNGESGTGKELVARALHDYGRRRAGPFVAINMAAIPRELIESELFGHERGAFTGALNRTQGRFEQASGGTLFLDEIGDMPPEAQTRLLRVLQEGEFTSVGGRHPMRANVRIVAATHRDLRQAIRSGQFREDLFYRLNVVPIRLPPLRERAEDIPLLARHFLERARESGLDGKVLDQGAVDALRAHAWPGNVRELENLMRRLAALYPQETITGEVVRAELAELAPAALGGGEPGQNAMSGPGLGGPGLGGAGIGDGAISGGGLGAAGGGGGAGEPLSRAVERHIRQFFAAHQGRALPPDIYDRVLAEVERPLIQMTLALTKGNQIKAASMLGLNRNTLRKKIRDLEIPVVRGVV
jgi:two-component system nitrogen regulation response regulator GlnG